MPTDVLERVRSEIEDRLAALSGAVAEAQELEIALAALEGVPVASRPTGDPLATLVVVAKRHAGFTLVKAAGAEAALRAQTTG